MTVEEREHGGYQVVASTVTTKFDYLVSRQQVYSWWRRRKHNGFPQGWEAKDGSGRRFYLDEVVEWYEVNYPESRRERLTCQREEKSARRATTPSKTSTTT